MNEKGTYCWHDYEQVNMEDSVCLLESVGLDLKSMNRIKEPKIK